MTETEKHELAEILRGVVSETVQEGHKLSVLPPGVYAPEIDIFIENLLPTAFKSNLEARAGRTIGSVAIECQGDGSPKHRLGDIVNAALHGDVGIVICDDEKHRERCLRIVRYLRHHNILRGRDLPFIMTLTEFIRLCKDSET